MSASGRRKAEMSRLRGENSFMRRELAKLGHFLAGTAQFILFSFIFVVVVVEYFAVRFHAVAHHY